MLSIFAKSFMVATKTDSARAVHQNNPHTNANGCRKSLVERNTRAERSRAFEMTGPLDRIGTDR